VIDVVSEGLRAVATRSPLAAPLVFAAGVATSAGPCVAPRYVAVTALAQSARRPWSVIVTFVSGIAAAYVVLGLVTGAVGALWMRSAPLYGLLGAALAAGGLVTLLRADGSPCREHAHARVVRGRGRSAGGVFLLGATSALVVSPCCTPVVAAIAGITTTGTRPLEGVMLLLAFALGHALPLAGAGVLGRRIGDFFSRIAASQAPAIVSGSLMLALGAYYGALA
jgi:cytochrome c-type biogenesis protein